MIPDHEETRGRWRNSVVHETVRELVAETSTQLRGKRNGAPTQAQYSMGPIEAAAREAGTGDMKATTEMEVFEQNLFAGA